MENFDFYSATFFAFGKERESDCGELVKQFINEWFSERKEAI